MSNLMLVIALVVCCSCQTFALYECDPDECSAQPTVADSSNGIEGNNGPAFMVCSLAIINGEVHPTFADNYTLSGLVSLCKQFCNPTSRTMFWDGKEGSVWDICGSCTDTAVTDTICDVICTYGDVPTSCSAPPVTTDVCKFHAGAGISTTDVFIGMTSEPAQCVAAVRAQHPQANGATHGTSNQECYANFNMTGYLMDPSYQSCWMDAFGMTTTTTTTIEPVITSSEAPEYRGGDGTGDESNNNNNNAGSTAVGASGGMGNNNNTTTTNNNNNNNNAGNGGEQGSTGGGGTARGGGAKGGKFAAKKAKTQKKGAKHSNLFANTKDTQSSGKPTQIGLAIAFAGGSIAVVGVVIGLYRAMKPSPPSPDLSSSKVTLPHVVIDGELTPLLEEPIANYT